MKEYPNYYSITPATVRYDNRLKTNEKLLFGEITALSNVKGYCYSTNKYFSKLYDVSITMISTWINHLKELGYIKVEMIKEEKEIKERHLFPVVDPIKEKFKENNTSNNNSSTTARDFLDNSTKDIESKQNAFEKYQIYVGMLSGRDTPIFIEYAHKLGDEAVGYAIDNVLSQTATPNFNYLNQILKKYEQLGVDTVEKAEEFERQHQASKKQTKKRKKKKSNRINTLPF